MPLRASQHPQLPKQSGNSDSSMLHAGMLSFVTAKLDPDMMSMLPTFHKAQTFIWVVRDTPRQHIFADAAAGQESQEAAARSVVQCRVAIVTWRATWQHG